MSTRFQALLAEVNANAEEAQTLAKSLPAAGAPDDKQVQAAAAEAGALTDEQKEAAEAAAAEAAKGKEAGGADEGKEPPMAKGGEAAAAAAAAGTEEEQFVDATELLKSMETMLGEHEDVLAKALPGIVSTIKTQGELIKSLHAEVVALCGVGRGRKSVVMAIERPAAGEGLLGKSQAEEGANTITPQMLLAKAETAFQAKHISGQEFTVIDVCLRQGLPVDANILRKVALAG